MGVAAQECLTAVVHHTPSTKLLKHLCDLAVTEKDVAVRATCMNCVRVPDPLCCPLHNTTQRIMAVLYTRTCIVHARVHMRRACRACVHSYVRTSATYVRTARRRVTVCMHCVRVRHCAPCGYD